MELNVLARKIIPPKTLALIKHIYSLIPIEKRIGKEYWKIKAFLNEAQWWDRERIEAWQFDKLKEIVQYAYDNVPGYYTLYKGVGIKPEDIKYLTDVRLLPFVTKELIRDNLSDFTARDISKWKMNYVTTGGSSGIPFGFYNINDNIWVENAFMHSGWERTGWKLSDRSVVLRGTYVGSEDKFWNINTLNKTLELSSYYLTSTTYPRYLKIIEKYRANYLQAYPSVATIFADLINENKDIGKVKFDVILLGSENIYKWQKEKLRASFIGSRIFGWYGHAEKVVLAPWCEKMETYHVWPFYGITEILNDEDMEVNTGEVGEIIGTSFWNHATPFIRYRTMDLARKGPLGCRMCGRQFMILDVIEGRLQEIIVTKNNRYISMTAINMHSDVFDNIKQFQFYQDTPGKVIFRILKNNMYKEHDTTYIYKELKKKIGEDMDLEIIFVNEIKRTSIGKYRFLEQKLKIKYGD